MIWNEQKKMFKSFKKILKRIVMLIVGIIALMIISIAIFMYTAPQFGQSPSGKDLERITQSKNYKDNQFVNLIETVPGTFKEVIKVLPDYLSLKNGSPSQKLEASFEELSTPTIDTINYVTWFGHSAFLIEMDDQRILIDPMFGPSTSPFPFMGSRFNYQNEIPIDQIQQIDAVILSHDHYDHLDYPTIKKIKDKAGHFYTPLGVGSHLKRWGVAEEKITEFDWWDSSNIGNIEIIACPSRHFSGRAIRDRNATLWASWVIKGKSQKIYFSGDSGYGDHFKTIGEKYGPFDLAMMECGQYNKAWHDIHMMPEESVQAGIDVQGRLLMPIHWGAFQLAIHSWIDPIERFTKESERLNVAVTHPTIGDRFVLGEEEPRERWWE